MKKNNAYCKEYVRSGEFLFDSPTYLKMNVVAIVIIAIS